ncbi:MAG: UDP-glucose 4-epimerase GalE [Acidobacteria bacterium]|nr:MAG: UDP-glucose 4-epimerase GalE [Acidobacteriota bacterium]PYS81366.1 MAG: UDP-glucose 4-epimerase GalE [Acidobacteriota bacterium]
MRVLVTGGAGYIGSVVAEELVRDGHEVTVYDSLYKGHRGAVVEGAEFVEGDLADGELLRATLRERSTEAVIHLAADSLVGESVENPAKYYRNNVTAGLALLDAMRDTSARRLVFSSTAAVYGEPEKQPVEESDPTRPTNPYGETKLAFERALQWYEQAYAIRHASLRYFNAAGATRACGEDHDPETHLIPVVLQAAAGRRAHVEVYGTDYPTRDGTCVRDYIHVVDLARAHVLALSILGERSAIYNLGCGGDGYTVNEVVETAREVTGRDIQVQTGARRAGDPAVLVASSEKIRRELGWSPRLQDLRAIISSAWEWMQEHPEGYRD